MKTLNLKSEAERCLHCKTPLCQKNCPISTDISKIIRLYKENKLEEAGEILFSNNPLSAVCAVVCAHENQCSGNCIRGIKGEPVDFPAIEKEISTQYLQNTVFNSENISKGDRIAIIGSGPSGITLAFILSKKGYKVTIFEKLDKLGGVLRYGIPDFRLSKDVLDLIEQRLLNMGVKIRYNDLIGPVTTVDKIFEDGYKAIFIGTGVWNPRPLSIKGETFGHVNYAINYLKSPSSYRLGKKVIVIGAGNVAMDAARTAKRSGSDVTIFYRRGFEDMTATKMEIQETMEDGVKFELFNSPVEILDEGVKFVKTKSITDENGRKRLITLEDSEFIAECDSVIIAVSQIPKDNIVSNTENIEVCSSGLVLTNSGGNTTREGVFAAGDVVTGAKTVVQAVADAKIVAETIHEYCSKKNK